MEPNNGFNKKGTGYYKVGAWFLDADEHYTDEGLLDPNATRRFLGPVYKGIMELQTK